MDGMTKWDISLLRHLNGEKTEEEWVYGAAMMTCATFLFRKGLVTGPFNYQINQAGKDFLKELDAENAKSDNTTTV